MAKRICVLDDDPKLRELLGGRLSKEGFEVILLSDSNTALDLLKGDIPDLLILDIMMPGLSGIDVLHMIRIQPELKMLPVIIMTNSSDTNHVVEAMSQGVTVYLQKATTSPEHIAHEAKRLLGI